MRDSVLSDEKCGDTTNRNQRHHVRRCFQGDVKDKDNFQSPQPVGKGQVRAAWEWRGPREAAGFLAGFHPTSHLSGQRTAVLRGKRVCTPANEFQLSPLRKMMAFPAIARHLF